MPELAPPAEPARTTRRAVGEIVGCSILVTAAAALAGLLVAVAFDARFAYAFVIARWICILLMLLTPILHRLLLHSGRTSRVPWAARTPATTLLLVCESIAFDIVSARLGD